MMAELGFTGVDGSVKRKLAVVDSGAAQCTISLQELRTLLPGMEHEIQKSTRVFSDASGRAMPALGCVRLTLVLGECPLDCDVYVFERMGVPFLLGTNALHEHGMVIDAHAELLYKKSDGKRCAARCTANVGGSRPWPPTSQVQRRPPCAACAKQTTLALGQIHPGTTRAAPATTNAWFIATLAPASYRWWTRARAA